MKRINKYKELTLLMGCVVLDHEMKNLIGENKVLIYPVPFVA